MNLKFILALSIGIVCGACSKQTSENRMGKQLYTIYSCFIYRNCMWSMQ